MFSRHSNSIYPATNGAYFKLNSDGVKHYQHEHDNRPIYICGQLYIRCNTASEDGNDWGILVHFKDQQDKEKQIVIPYTTLQGDGLKTRELLSDLGLHIAQTPKARRLFIEYLTSQKNIGKMTTTDKIGWNGKSFVLPQTCITSEKDDALPVIYKGNQYYAPYEQKGTLEQWRENIGSIATGNSRLIFALSLAFACPLAPIMGVSNTIGFHMRGDSRSGKTKTANAALSVYGNPSKLIKTWHNTANALEGIMGAHNHSMLALDELSMIDPSKLFSVIYAIGNGQIKGRSTVSGENRPVKTWQLFYLSTGEESLKDVLSKAKNNANAGQELRFLDLDADAGKGMGIFDTIPENKDPITVIQELDKSTANYYGTAGMAWLEYLVQNKRELEYDVESFIYQFMKAAITDQHTNQHQSTARYFAMIAAAGELATNEGLTGWQSGESIDACRIMFDNWVSNFGTGNKEENNIISHVRKFIELHGASRFESINSDGNERIINRVGFARAVTDGNGYEYLVTPETFEKELLAGYNQRKAIKALLSAGMLIQDKDGASSQRATIHAMNSQRMRVYVIRYSADNE
jgi:uncharacterized protein (DUF927 family)